PDKRIILVDVVLRRQPARHTDALVRPLVAITDSEENSFIVEVACYNAVVVLFSATRIRSSCLHANMLEQLCNFVLTGDNFVPKPENWSDLAKQLIILSLDELTNTQGKRSKNCELIMRKLWQGGVQSPEPAHSLPRRKHIGSSASSCPTRFQPNQSESFG
ncbi:hypothetical protein AAVH_32225, partial [Aphelenchoides avenae]